MMDHADQHGWLPALLDEARCPLRKMEEVPQLCSVQWGSSHPLVADLGIPPFHAVEELVMHVVDRLGLGKEDLVVGVVIFERCAKRHRGLLRVSGVRRLFLGCCIIARKTGSDERILLDWFSERLQDGFSAVDPTALKLIESQVLAVLFSRGGLPCAAAVYAAYAEALWDRANEVVGVQRAMPPILVSFD